MGLRAKKVYRNKEDNLTLYGLPGWLAVLVGGFAVFLMFTVNVLVGLFVGIVLSMMAYAIFAGKPPLWPTYEVAAIVRGRTVMSPAVAADIDIEGALEDARALYEDR